MGSGKIICAVRNNVELSKALSSKQSIVFLLSTNIEEVQGQIALAHQKGKKLFVHVDLAEGIGKDVYGIRYLKKVGVDGIISTRTNIIKFARQEGLATVQRFFIVDSHSVDTTVDSAITSKADMIEIMPGTVTKVITKLKGLLNAPIVAGGLIESEEEVENAINSGAAAVSTGKSKLWEI